ncbi:MAG: hypothetical protein HYU36_11510 [Planctomycetes bacterium]|nr:hypothetical protein [Planctomycetota bacterium]
MIEILFDTPDRPVPATKPSGKWSGEWASQSPLNHWHRATEGGGAEGNSAYCALVGEDSDEFYAESTPNWWTPSTVFDLRGTRVSFHLKAVKPITVAPGYHPHLFIVIGYQDTRDHSGWYTREPLRIGQGCWALNELVLRPDPALWLRYWGQRTIEEVLTRVGFIGVMYLRDGQFRGVHATGVLGIDRFRYDLKG